MFQKRREQKLVIKLSLYLLYLIIITILFIAAYNIYKDSNTIKSFNKVEKTSDYAYINISRMSNKFAYYKDKNIGIHYVMEIEDTNKWHTYLIAINEDNISKYQELIDYTNNKVKKAKPIKVYGYPIVISDELKNVSIKHINEFLPKENEVNINKDNYDDYLTNCYLDTTKSKKEDFNLLLFIVLFLILIMIFLMIYTLLENNIVVKQIDEYIEKNKSLIRKVLKKKRRK
ncbi:MAG: hypothetical protein IJI43_04165 [Bacilli bacterium]|nr:hypothetical protein [Bacilli bacterium]